MNPRDRTPRLGRGLAALLGEAAVPAEETEHTVRMLQVGALRVGPFQPRQAMPQDGLDSLAASILSSGILQPILVRPEPDEADAWQIIAGERRWRAAQIAGLHEVPCLIRRLSDPEAMAAGLVENLQRQDLNAIEEAEGYRRLATEFGLTQEDVAQTVGRSRAHIANTMRLLNLPPTVQSEVRNGTLSAGHARALLAHPDPARAALQVIARSMNVRQTEALAQSQTHRATHGNAQKDADTRALEHELSSHLGLGVTVHHGATGGTVKISYKTLDQLDALVQLLRPG